MKKFGLFILLILLFPVVQAVHINSYNVETNIDGGIVTEKLTVFVTSQGENSVRLIAPPEIQKLDVKINNLPVTCNLRELIGGSEINCPVNVQEDYFIDVSYQTKYPLISLKNKQLFSQEFNLNDKPDEFNLKVKLPIGAFLPEEPDRFLTPQPSEIYFDGRHVILQYQAFKINSYKTSIIYTPKPSSTLSILPWFLLIIALLVFVRFKLKKTKRKEIYLLPDEREIIRILKNSKHPSRQKDIEKQIEFSKAKLSRMLRNLEERGLIKRIPKGNSNLIQLKKMK